MPPLSDYEKLMEEIWNEATSLVESRFVFRHVNDIASKNSVLASNIFFEHYAINYASAMVSGIFRQIDDDPNARGLRHLLGELRDNADKVTKKYFLSRVPTGGIPWLAEQVWTDNFGGGVHLDPAIPANDIDLLRRKTHPLLLYRHKHIAHKDKARYKFDLNFNELDEALDVVEQLVIKYNMLFSGGSSPGSSGLMPSILYDWERIFREPWIT